MSIPTPTHDMSKRSTKRPLGRALLLVSAALAMALAAPVVASAQGLRTIAEVEIDRDTDDLRHEIRPRPTDVDIADTLLVFSNSGPEPAEVRCVAWLRDGTPFARAYVMVPGSGVKFMAASDISGGKDFIGQVTCHTQQHVVPSAIFLGPQIENLNVRVTGHDVRTRIRFPLVATY